MVDAEKKCCLCMHQLPPDADACPHCGNVFRKDEGEWEWSLIPKEARIKKSRGLK